MDTCINYFICILFIVNGRSTYLCTNLLILFMVDCCNLYDVFPCLNYLLNLLMAEQGV